MVSAQPGPETGSFVSPSAAGKYGPSKSADFFFIGAWCQQPEDAALFKKAGFNAYVSLWQCPTEAQLALLRQAGMPVICEQNEVALKHLDDPLILGWMQPDEPDIAQMQPDGNYGPCMDPATLMRAYAIWKERDPQRPVYLGLSKGVSDINWHGRGVCTGKWQMYPEYIKSCDIVSFDIYPANDHPGELWRVPKGVDSLYAWSDRSQPVWCAIECTKFNRRGQKPTPAEVRTEIWMALIHGVRGIIYFCHGEVEAAVRYTTAELPDPEMREAVNRVREAVDRETDHGRKFYERALLANGPMLLSLQKINGEIQALAPVLNSPTLKGAVSITSSDPAIPIDIMVKQKNTSTYIFAVSMRPGEVRGSFSLKSPIRAKQVEVAGEGRTIEIKNGIFEDSFTSYAVHHYKITE
jgi:hypothetical protein